ncbi:Inner membrane protein YbaL [Aquicella siphonis]|uniref:Inner membrane protein YbaL n=1 Tax=Aquicella siphonis TaxID=254247 RepID=A0A5E4PG40_9COXI|nr:cation:proton antiporter [Aquicella siphonis]VVC75478.1 Inner membrane protein YbaL [Aquicella siphonis]
MHTPAMIFIQDLAIIMLIAGFVILLCHQLRQPIVLGYIIAGVIIGSHTPPFSLITDEATIKTLAELGVIFLMFSLGLEFNFRKLGKVGKTAIIAAGSEIIFMVWLGYEIGLLLGWTRINAIFLGAVLSISSTTIIVKALTELKMKNESFSQIIFGILIIEDIFAILILALLSSIATSGTLQFKDAAITAAKLSSFLTVSLIAGILFIPRLLSYIAKFKNDEVLLITVLGLCFGFCLLVVEFNYSVALGAFIIGAIIAESNQITRIEHLINPIRDMFSAIFFVSVGLLFDPGVLAEYFIPIVVITMVVIIGKVMSCSLGVLITGHSGRTAMRAGMGLAQIGEFSFIIASLGITLNVTGNFLYSIAVCVSIITTLTTPFLIKYSDPFTRLMAGLIPQKIAATFKIYTNWLQNIRPSEDQLMLEKTINRSLVQVIINIFIVIAIFLSGTYIANTELGNTIIRITNHHLQQSMIWASALIISLPFLIAAYRKIIALSMILAELGTKDRAGSHMTYKIRKIISGVIPMIFISTMMLLISLLSASILPPLELLFLILILAGILIAIVWPWFVKLHAKLQITLMESINKDQGKKNS